VVTYQISDDLLLPMLFEFSWRHLLL
jgi:hypothetical protein